MNITMQMQDRIADAVGLCARYAFGQARPFQRVGDFLAMLKLEGWTSVELTTIQSRVIEMLTSPEWN